MHERMGVYNELPSENCPFTRFQHYVKIFKCLDIDQNTEFSDGNLLEYRFEIKEVCRLKLPVSFGFSPGDKRAGDRAV